MKRNVITYYEFLEALSTIRKFKKQVPLLYKEMEEEVNSISKFVNAEKNTKICQLPLSTRAMNVLKTIDQIDIWEGTTQDLAKLSMKELLLTKNAGRKTVQRDKGTLSVRQPPNEKVAKKRSVLNFRTLLLANLVEKDDFFTGTGGILDM